MKKPNIPPPSSPSQATTASTESADSAEPAESPPLSPAHELPLPPLGEPLDDVRQDRAALCELVDMEGILEAKRQIHELQELMGEAGLLHPPPLPQ